MARAFAATVSIVAGIGRPVLVSGAPSGAAGLYGIANTGGPISGGLVVVDVATGVLTPVGSALGPELVAQELSTIDLDMQTYYVIGAGMCGGQGAVVIRRHDVRIVQG